MSRQWIAAGIVALSALPGADHAWADVELAVMSTAPARAHFVAAGTSTSFVLSARNTAAVAATVTVRIQTVSGTPGEWQALLSGADALFRPVGAPAEAVTVTVPAREAVQVVALVAAGAALPEGAEGGALVRLGGRTRAGQRGDPGVGEEPPEDLLRRDRRLRARVPLLEP